MGPDSGEKTTKAAWKKNEKRERSRTMKIEVERKYNIATQLRAHCPHRKSKNRRSSVRKDSEDVAKACDVWEDIAPNHPSTEDGGRSFADRI